MGLEPTVAKGVASIGVPVGVRVVSLGSTAASCDLLGRGDVGMPVWSEVAVPVAMVIARATLSDAAKALGMQSVGELVG
jgi:hypothetical protein